MFEFSKIFVGSFIKFLFYLRATSNERYYRFAMKLYLIILKDSVPSFNTTTKRRKICL